MTNFTFADLFLVYAEWRIRFLYFVRLANTTSEKPFVIKDLLEYLEASRGNSRAGTNYLEPGISPFLSASSIDSPPPPRIRTLIVVPFLLAGDIDLARQLTADC